MAGSTTELIKEKIDVVDFLKGYLTLTPAGKNFKALCPFHREKSPSFMVSPDRQTWHCFGCAKHGDVFTFLMEYENLEFGDALRVLAEKAGVELKRINPTEYKYLGLLYDLNDAAKDFWKKELLADPVAQQYLKERGLTQETIEEFAIGWAPNEPEKLTREFLKRGISPEDLVRAGLVFQSDHGGKYDRFRGRIMFPIHNHLGKVVGFTGRVLPQFDDGKMGKYINSPETAIFNKSKLLYGLWKSKNHIREKGSAFLVEGQMDFLMSWQAGVKHAVASSGTAFTGDHLHVLRRLTDEIIVSFDNDEAGREAGERAIDLATAQDFRVRVVMLTGGLKDPAELAQENPEALMRAVEQARPAPEFYFEKYLGSGSIDLRDRGLLARVRAVLGKIKAMASAVEQGFWIKELAKRTHLDERTLEKEAEHVTNRVSQVANRKTETNESISAEEKPQEFSRRALLSERLISATLGMNDMQKIESIVPYMPEDYRIVCDLLKTGARKSDDTDMDELINLLILRSEQFDDAEFERLANDLKMEAIKDLRRELTLRVKQAEADGNEEELAKALEELNGLPTQ
jgi:DNA primase